MAVKAPVTSRSQTSAKRSYVFRVLVERDGRQWRAVCPALERQGAATWGTTQEEAFRNIREVIELVVESMRERGERVPTDIASSPHPLVTVTA